LRYCAKKIKKKKIYKSLKFIKSFLYIIVEEQNRVLIRNDL